MVFMTTKFIYKFLSAIAATALLVSCEKTKTTIPPEQVHFTDETLGTYYITNSPTTVFKIPVGITAASNVDRTFQFSVSSPTGATAGSQYNLASNSIVIPAGSVLEYIDLNGIFSGYATGRKDTLIFKLTGGDLPILTGADEYKVALQKYCDVIPSDFAGNYANSFDLQDDQVVWGPYGTRFSNITSTGATTATIKIINFWDVGTSTTVNLDWTDPSNFKTTIPVQFLYNDATYGAAKISGVGNGTFSSCDTTFSFSYTVTVAAGSFGNFITTIAK